MNIAVCSLLVLLFAFTLRGSNVEAKRHHKKKHSSRPNIIFILMDDLDIQLGSMEVMRKTRKIFENEGAEFVNAFVTSPICCPSRSSILTGMYAHNHGCMTNTVNCASMSWRRGPEKKNFGHYMQSAGYKTGYFGKYLNGYDGTWIPNGWDDWSALIKNSRFYDYTLNRNKIKEHHGNLYQKDYFTDVITNYSIEFLQESRTNEPHKPVMMVLSMAAPHGPEDPAPQHQKLFKNVTAPRYPNFNVHSTDKHWLLQYTKTMDAKKIAFADLIHRRRLLTLLSVDDAIHRLYQSLKTQGMLDNTYVFFSSDHGYHLGQFGLAKGKSMPYESDIRVPFYALGPKVPRGARIEDIVLNIDLAPTFLDLGKMRVPGTMDGRSIVDLLESSDRPWLNWRESFLVEKAFLNSLKPQATMEIEIWKLLLTLYSFKNNTSSLVSRLKINHLMIYDDFEQEKNWLRLRDKRLSIRKTQQTNFFENRKTLYASKYKSRTSSKVDLIREKCRLLSYPQPCRPGQQWTCVMHNGQLRLRKCRRATENPEGQGKRVPRSSLKKDRCKCSNKERGHYNYRRTGRRNSDTIPRGHYRWYYKSSRARKEYKKLQNYEHHLKKESSASYSKKVFKKTMQMQLKNLNSRIHASRQHLANLRSLKNTISKLTYRPSTSENIWCTCVNGRTFQIQRVKHGDNRMITDTTYPIKVKQSIDEATKMRKLLKKLKKKRKNCAIRGLNCFEHTNQHWKTAPLWKNGSFCFCPTSSNNTYWCLRTINTTHNFLYCEFVTSFCEFFDLNADPYQLTNKINTLSQNFHEHLHHQLEFLASCRHSKGCDIYTGRKIPQKSFYPLSKACTNRKYSS